MPPATELVQSGAGVIYRLRRGRPRGGLVVMLHGLGGDENVMWIFDHALPRAVTVIAPRAPYPGELGGYSWAPAAVRDDLDQIDFREALIRLSRFVNEVMTLYEAEPRQVIVIGFSQGAALSYAFSLAHPQVVRGVTALAGFLPRHARRAPAAQTGSEPSRAAGPAKDAWPRYLIIHGTHDEAVPIERAREARAVLQSYGASVEYHEHRVGHKVSAQGMKEIARWMAESLGKSQEGLF